MLVCLILTLFLHFQGCDLGGYRNTDLDFWRILAHASAGCVAQRTIYSVFSSPWVCSSTTRSLSGNPSTRNREAVDASGSPKSEIESTPLLTAGRRKLAYLEAAISGAQEVSLPVIVAVMIVLVAFLLSLFLPGWASGNDGNRSAWS